jgi:hypothetical protein
MGLQFRLPLVVAATGSIKRQSFLERETDASSITFAGALLASGVLCDVLQFPATGWMTSRAPGRLRIFPEKIDAETGSRFPDTGAQGAHNQSLWRPGVLSGEFVG